MTTSSSYYIFGGGRWREVDVETGRVEGWGPARFAVAGRRRLRMARTNRVLAALRALAMGRLSDAKLGPRLPPMSISSDVNKHFDREMTEEQPRCCHNNVTGCCNTKSAEKAAPLKAVNTGVQHCTVDVAVQTSLSPLSNNHRRFRSPPPAHFEIGRKHASKIKSHPNRTVNRDSSSSTPERQRQITVTASIHNQKTNSPQKADRRKRNDSEETVKIPTRETIAKAKERIELSSLSDSDFVQPRKIMKPMRKELRMDKSKRKQYQQRKMMLYLKPNRNVRYNRRQTSSLSSTSIENFSTERNIHRSQTERQNGNVAPVSELIVDEDDVEVYRKYLINHVPDFDLAQFDHDDDYKLQFFYKIHPVVKLTRCPLITELLADNEQRNLKEFASHLGLCSVSEVSTQRSYRLRKITNKKSNLDRRDRSMNVNKKKNRMESPVKHRTKLTSKREAAQTKESSSSDSKASHSSYTSSGLDTSKSFSEKSKKTKIYKKRTLGTASVDSSNAGTAKKVTKKLKNYFELSKDEEIVATRKKVINSELNKDKENVATKKKYTSGKEFPGSIRQPMVSLTTERLDNKEVGNRRKESENVDLVKNKDPTNIPREKNKRKRDVMLKSVSSSKEYSVLEDHAIVSWVSGGGRARLVNGNRLWRELQEAFPRIAGRERTWQSLRNRYLRYILPTLSQLALAPAHAARLRAAAHTGELKGGKRPPKRNSIFGEPSRGALSRRPALTHSNSRDSRSRSRSSRDSEFTEPPPKKTKLQHKESPVRSLPSSNHRTSPRYSDITRAFNNRHNQIKHSTPTPSPDPTPTPSPDPTPPPKGLSSKLSTTKENDVTKSKNKGNTNQSRQNSTPPSSTPHNRTHSPPDKRSTRLSVKKVTDVENEQDKSSSVDPKRRSLRSNPTSSPPKDINSKHSRTRKLFTQTVGF